MTLCSSTSAMIVTEDFTKDVWEIKLGSSEYTDAG